VKICSYVIAFHRIAVFLLVAGSLSAQGDLVVRAEKAHLGTGKVIAPAVIHISGGKILAIASEMLTPAGATDIDLGKAVLTPGLVDGLSYAGLPRGIAENEEGRELTPRFDASLPLDALKEDLVWLREQGVTSLMVHPGSRNVVGGMVCHVKPRGQKRADIVVASRLGLRFTLGPDASRGNRGLRFGRPGPETRLPNSRMGTIYLIRTAFTEALDYKEERARDPKTPRDPDLDVYVEVLEGRLPAYFQARSAKDINGLCNLVREFKLEHCVVVDAWEAEHVSKALKQLEIPVLLGPLIHPRTHWGGRRDEGRRHSMAGAALLARKGITAAFSHGGFAPGETLMDSLRLAVRAGLPRAEALSWVTLRPAKILGLDKSVGSLEVGKDADLVAWSGDPLAATSAATWVMIDGRVLHKQTGAKTGATVRETGE